MKINDNPPAYLGNLYKIYQDKTQPLEKSPDKNAAAKDSLELSEKAREIKRLVKETEKLPDIRKEKVARIIEQIDNGVYNIPADKVAAKMLSEE
jgi:negative regulator of flagellin synthesis FlgM